MDGLKREDLTADPFEQFRLWFKAAEDAKLPLPEAMTLSTATREGRPSARLVLLKSATEGVFTFYTNYESRKSQDLMSNPHASLVFYWPTLERQIRIEGRVEKVSRETSEAYFATRARDSQLGAWASHQSQPLTTDTELWDQLHKVRERFEGKPVLCPPNWGGFALTPERIEFWQGQPHRLHDRFEYTRDTAVSPWRINRLSP